MTSDEKKEAGSLVKKLQDSKRNNNLYESKTGGGTQLTKLSKLIVSRLKMLIPNLPEIDAEIENWLDPIQEYLDFLS